MARKRELDKEGKKFFKKIEDKDYKTMYHTKIFSMINNFEARPNKGKFWLCFRNVFNPNKYESLHLFHVRQGDKFLGIFYGFTKLSKPFIINYEENQIKKTTKITKGFYVEFRFKKGSVFCYLRSLSTLLKAKNKGKTFYNSLLNRTLKLEREVHQFYSKEYVEDKGIIKWIEKNQK
ncbi:partition protein (plasmid) [Candidatus Borreliella tachyglossi]|uniref:Partition protein n=2 Tax=Candidatus Borreliella tachyglossi TaxID=1964448 RepID=A0A2S1LYP2_9SPIR|nr:partition protein [Candidatus Borreliella tachyglossi]